jgi:hypothetical protein
VVFAETGQGARMLMELSTGVARMVPRAVLIAARTVGG